MGSDEASRALVGEADYRSEQRDAVGAPRYRHDHRHILPLLGRP